jgi:L-fuculose-phosphate aldolase
MNKMVQELRVELIETAKRALSDGLIWGSAGNFSVRDPQTGNILITPSGVEYTNMLPADIVTLDLDGEKLEGKLQPSTEAPVHCAVYRARPDVEAIVHTEPQYVNAFGTARVEMPIVTHNLGKINKSVQIGPWIASGSEAFAEETSALLGDQYAIIWPNHGLLVVGSSIYDAYMHSWYLENNAKVFILAKMLGEPQPPAEGYYINPEE